MILYGDHKDARNVGKIGLLKEKTDLTKEEAPQWTFKKTYIAFEGHSLDFWHATLSANEMMIQIHMLTVGCLC